LAKMRPVPGRHEQAYAADYRAIEGAQRLAGQYQVGIVFNHHLRKMSSEDDAFDDVSGTLGLTGAADTIILMKRHSGLTKICVRGRDIEEAEFAAEFNRNTCRWRLVGEAEDVFRSHERQRIIAALKQAAPDPMSIGDIMAATERRDRNATKSLLHKMKTAGEVTSEKGYYSLPPTDLPTSVDRVDLELGSASPVSHYSDNQTIPGIANSQCSGQCLVNAPLTIDPSLTAGKVVNPLKANGNSDPVQRVNAVNGSKHSALADPWADLGIPDYLDRRPTLGPPGDTLDDLEAPFGGSAA